MRGCRIHDWGGPLQLEQLEDPKPRDTEVLVRVEACGVGLTVLNCLAGDLGNNADDLPRVPGHEIVGTIVELGAKVAPQRLGERVVAFFYLFCGRCRNCLAGKESLCMHLEGFIGVNRDGGYAQLAALPQRNAVSLRDDLDAAAASAIPDAIATPVHVARRANIGPSDRVAVIAAGGGVGVHMIQVARLHGARVVGLDAFDQKLSYLEAELGIEAIDSSDFQTTQLPSAWTGTASVVIDLLGRRESLRWAIDHLATDGRLITLTTFPGTELSISPRELVLSQASILGSRYASRYELLEAAALVSEGRLQPVVSDRAPIEHVDRIHQAVAAGTLLGRGAVVW
jgi:D-arabinose 1-dehydrogenase-like Zn-dependent alcohol dehydrogenase